MNLVITGVMTFELVPPEQMGRWLGMVRFFRMLVAASAAYLAGAIWDTIPVPCLYWAGYLHPDTTANRDARDKMAGQNGERGIKIQRVNQFLG